jgi:hypothetical protein
LNDAASSGLGFAVSSLSTTTTCHCSSIGIVDGAMREPGDDTTFA